MSVFVLWLASLSFVGFGLACAIAPAATFSLFGLTVGADPWTTELRAFYGGLEIGIGALLAYCAMRAPWRSFGLCLVMASFGGIGLVRIIAMVVDGSMSNALLGAGAFEIALAVLAGIALLRR